jgi:hypothetical protein
VAKGKTTKTRPTAAARSPKSRARAAAFTTSDVARLAYDFYLARGSEPGHDVEDWIRAERMLRDAVKNTKSSRRSSD